MAQCDSESAISPPGTGKDHQISIEIDGILADTDAIAFSYSAPYITATIAPGFTGGTLQVKGVNFGFDHRKVTI